MKTSFHSNINKNTRPVDVVYRKKCEIFAKDFSHLPFSSSFFAFFLNVFHHDVKSRFDGGAIVFCGVTGVGGKNGDGAGGGFVLSAAIFVIAGSE